MTKLEVGVSDTPIERQRLSVGQLCLRQLVGSAQLAPLLQGVTILHPNGPVLRISVENLPVEPGGELPLPRVSSAIRKGERVAFPMRQTEARPINNPVQCHFTINRLAGVAWPGSEAPSDARARPRTNVGSACRHSFPMVSISTTRQASSSATARGEQPLVALPIDLEPRNACVAMEKEGREAGT